MKLLTLAFDNDTPKPHDFVPSCSVWLCADLVQVTIMHSSGRVEKAPGLPVVTGGCCCFGGNSAWSIKMCWAEWVPADLNETSGDSVLY